MKNIEIMRKLKFLMTYFILSCYVYANAVQTIDNKKTDNAKNKTNAQFGEPLLPKLKLRNFSANNDELIVGHFYQHIDNGVEGQAGWNVTSVGTVLCSDYYRFGLTIDQGDYTSSTDKFMKTDIGYRIGVQIDQVYTGNDSITFGVWLATGPNFPGVGMKSEYWRQVNETILAGIDIRYLVFGSSKHYLSIAPTFSRTIKNQKFTIKPYYSRSVKNKVNLLVSDKFFMKQKINYMELMFISGYYPNWNTIINYDRINNKRYEISCEGAFNIIPKQLIILPALGLEYTKLGNRTSFNTNWYVQLGVRVEL